SNQFVVHMLTTPVFMAGTVAFFWGFCALSIALSLTGLLAMTAAIAAQAWSHKKESEVPVPFASRTAAFARIILEQWVTFPRYVAHRTSLALRCGSADT